MLKFTSKKRTFKPLQAWAAGTTSYQWLFQWCSLASRWGIHRKRDSWMAQAFTKRWSKHLTNTPKNEKTSWSSGVFFWFESFDVIHCSIWRFVLSELLWCHVTSRGGSARNPDVLANPPLHVSKRIVLWEMHCSLHQVPQKYIPLELHHCLADDLWKTPTSVDFGVSLRHNPSRHCRHRGHCGHHIERGRRDATLWDGSWRFLSWSTCFLLFFILRYWKRWIGALLQKNLHDFDSKVVSCQDRPTTSSSRVRQVPKLCAWRMEFCSRS